MTLSGRTVAYVNNFPESHLGGGEVYLMHLARGAMAAGMRAMVVAMPGSGLADAAEAADATVVREDVMAGTPTKAAGRVAEHLRSAGADIIHGTGYFTNMVARLAGSAAGCRVVNSVLCEPRSTLAFRSSARDRLVQWVRQMADNTTAGKVDVIIANSTAVKDGLVAQGLPEDRIRVIVNAIDPDAVRAEAAAGAAPAEVPGAAVPGAAARVGTVGRLEAVKGLDVLLDAAGLLARDVGDDMRFFIAGEGVEGERLAARVREDKELVRAIRFLGFVPSAPALMASLDIYCLPSLSEGLNTTILEALALGVPVVATDVGGAREIIEDGVTGRLVPAGDARALADALAATAADPHGARRMGAAGRERVDRDFAVTRMVARTLEVYDEVLES